MGMFDTFIFKRRCPECSNILEEWQTKQLVRECRSWYICDSLHRYAPKNCKVECHAWCNYCDKMLYAWAIIKDRIYINHIIPPKEVEVSGIQVCVDG